jgi:Leucine-rich repeat (LRR) protein
MPHFTKEQEERAVALILEECNISGEGDRDSSGIRNMSYVERDSEGYVVGLVDLGLQRLSTVVLNGENDDHSARQTTSATTKTRHWNMPSAIGYLTRLRKLTVYHCKSLPLEISLLSDSLQEIAFHFCDELDFDTLPQEFEHLKQITDFRIHGRTAIGTTTDTQRILPIHRLQNLSNLRYLYYRSGPSMDSLDNGKEGYLMLNRAIGIPTPPDANSRLIQDLLRDKVKFKNSLEILEIEGGKLTEFTVAQLFSDVLPQYPNLKRLILPNNKIRSLAPIIAQQPPVIPHTVRLRCFYLLGNPVLDVRNSSPRSSPDDELLLLRPEQANLLLLLSLYEEITSLGHGITESGLCTTDMLLALGKQITRNDFVHASCVIPVENWCEKIQ